MFRYLVLALLAVTLLAAGPSEAGAIRYKFVDATLSVPNAFVEKINGTFSYDTHGDYESAAHVTLSGKARPISGTYTTCCSKPVQGGCDFVGACLNLINKPSLTLSLFFYFQGPLDTPKDALIAVNCDGEASDCSNPDSVVSGYVEEVSRPKAQALFAGLTSSGIPEPSVWAMTLAGLGGVGGAMRRRRSRFDHALPQ